MTLPVMTFKRMMILSMVLTSFVTMLVAGSLISIFRYQYISNDIKEQVETISNDIAFRTEEMLQGVEQNLYLLLRTSRVLDERTMSDLLRKTMMTLDDIRAIYFIDQKNLTFAVATHDEYDPFASGNIGIDFSYSSLSLAARNSLLPQWSDKFVSILSGDTSIGVAARVENFIAIAELDLDNFYSLVEGISDPSTRLWVVDRRGELVVDTGNSDVSGIINVGSNPAFKQAIIGESFPSKIKLDGLWFSTATTVSNQLGWIFITGKPAGLYNSQIWSVIVDLLLLSSTFIVIILIVFPYWSHRISNSVNGLCYQADQIIAGKEIITRKPGYIKEFNDLSNYLMQLLQGILDREQSLKEWNQELEARVSNRTALLEESNAELSNALEYNNKMQEALVDTEKQAALGRLVAGVAHELNTPLGNALMVISSLDDELSEFSKEVEEGLRKRVLDSFLRHLNQGLDIAMKNMTRAAELITSFKHVANDQTHSIRRQFYLNEVLTDVLVTLHPTLKRYNHEIKLDFQEKIKMDSYPGVLSQISTNLISNALYHAWDKNEKGTLIISMKQYTHELAGQDSKNNWVELNVRDDGRGIDETLIKHIFEPFFSTKMGQGGTGLGLHISYNAARNILGGILECSSTLGEGAVFILKIPLEAPYMDE